MLEITGKGQIGGEIRFTSTKGTKSVGGSYLGHGWHNPWVFSQYVWGEDDEGEIGWNYTGFTEGHPSYENCLAAVKKFLEG